MWMGKWSLPREGPLVIVYALPRWGGDIRVRSFVESLKSVGFCLVPRLFVVVSMIFSFSSIRLATALPLWFDWWQLDSQTLYDGH
jgi:hypothetical protein